MSRSVKRSPFAPWCYGGSDKRWKQSWHREMRAATRAATRAALHRFDGDADFLPHHREVSDVWESQRPWWIRFDPTERPELMRK